MKLGAGDLFLGDGTYLGSCSEAEISVVAPSDPEWPEVVLEDILDAEYLGEE